MDTMSKIALVTGAGRGLGWGIARAFGIAGWKVEFLTRSTFLADRRGVIAAVWGRVRVRGHASEVLAAARALDAVGPDDAATPGDRPSATP